MTVTEPAYTARILGTPDIPVSLRTDAGSLTLDMANAPHVTGEVTLSLPDAVLLDDLDPRENRRLVIDIAGRSFDLGVREAIPNREAATVNVSTASDEALLDDFAQLVDDSGPRAHEASLRAVTDYVLGKIGAALEPGALDADVTAYWELTNRAVNGGARVDATGWTPGSGTSAVARTTSPTIHGMPTIRYTASGTGQAFLNTPVQDVRVQPGQMLTTAVYMSSATTGRPARIMMRFRDQAGNIVLDSYSEAVTSSTDAAAPTTLSRTRRVPPNAVSVSVYVNTMTNSAPQNHFVTGLILVDGDEVVPFFDGASSDAHYTYAWEDAANNSTSTRTPLVERDPASLMWPAGRSGLEFLRPLLLSAGLRLVCDEQRRWTIRDASWRTPGLQAYRTAVNLTSADERLSREDTAWFDGMVCRYTWTDKDGIEQTRDDAFALTATPTKVILREINAPYPGPGRAEYAVRRAQGKGRTVTVSRQARWNEHAEQLLTVTLEGTPIQTGIAEKVVFDIAEDTVTTTARTTDTPASAWQLIPIGEAWLDSPVGGTWIGEVI